MNFSRTMPYMPPPPIGNSTTCQLFATHPREVRLSTPAQIPSPISLHPNLTSVSPLQGRQNRVLIGIFDARRCEVLDVNRTFYSSLWRTDAQ